MFKAAKVSFTITIGPERYTHLVKFAERYNIKSKSKAVEFCIQKAVAHDKLIEISQNEELQKKIELQAKTIADELYQARVIKAETGVKK